MSAYFRLLSAERLKIMKSWVWLLVLVSPAIALLLGFIAEPVSYWDLMASQATFHAMLFLPIFTGVFASFICRFEHAAGGWKQVLVLPVSRFTFYAAKLTVIMLLILIIQLLLLLSLLAAGAYHGMGNDIPLGNATPEYRSRVDRCTASGSAAAARLLDVEQLWCAARH